MKTAEAKKSGSQHVQHKPTLFFKKKENGDFFSEQVGSGSSPSFFGQPVQAKLTIGQPNDKYEQEADATADRVVRKIQTSPDKSVAETPRLQTSAYSGYSVQRACTECPEKEKLQKQEEEQQAEEQEVRMKPIFESNADPSEEGEIRKKSSGEDTTASPDLESRLNSSKGQGRPLDANTRVQMESGMGADFGGVQIHTGQEAVQMNQELNAKAFTHGSDIYFNHGNYDTGSSSGKQLLAHELTHVRQQRNNTIHRQESSEKDNLTAVTDFLKIDEKISSVKQKRPQLVRKLDMVTFRSVLFSDRIFIKINGDPKIQVFPCKSVVMTKGFYAFQWDSNGNIAGFISLESTTTEKPLAKALAGISEIIELRKNRIGVVWVKQTVKKQEPKPPSLKDLELPLSEHEINEDIARWYIETYPPRPMSISGLTGGIFDPNYKGPSGKTGYYGNPLNFTYFTNDGLFAIVSRSYVGRDFWYLVPIRVIADYLRFYPIVYAGIAGRGAVILATIIVDVGMSFIPVIGPLWALFQVSQQVYYAYNNWDKMNGWEKGLLAVTVLLHAIPIVRTGAKIVRGTLAFKKGVNSLIASGVSRADAHRLMLMAGVFQSQKSALRIVDNLGDALRQGKRLTSAELRMVEEVFHLMLQRLPAAERIVITASFATKNLYSARKYMYGLKLTQKQFEGLKRLIPEVLVSLRRIARSEPILVQKIATWAAKSDDLARGINKLQGITKQGHLAYVISALGEDILGKLGTGTVKISDDLASFVIKARSARLAYSRLMLGKMKGKTTIPGLNIILSSLRSAKLSDSLLRIEQQFSKIYLTTQQLSGLARLNTTTLKALSSATDSQLRAIGSIAQRSSHAAKAIDQLAAKLNTNQLSEIINYLGGGLLDTIGKMGIKLSDDLVRAAMRKRTAYLKQKTLLEGIRYRGTAIPGLLDKLAINIKTKKGLEIELSKLEYFSHQSDLFARWAIMNPVLIEGTSNIIKHRPKDFQSIIAKIYKTYPGNCTVILKSFAQAERMYGSGINFGRLMGEIAAGGEKAMGSSFILEYIVKRNIGTISSFEHALAVGNRSRVYDILANGISYEFKFWFGFAGKPARSAANQFARDIILHAGTGFKNLRWVFPKQVETSVLAIESMMRGVLSRPSVRAALRRQGISSKEALKRLEIAFDRGLIEFF